VDVDNPSPLGNLFEMLVGFLDEAAETSDEGEAFIERFEVQLPIELYFGEKEEEGFETYGKTAERTFTPFNQVLHRLTIRAEVDIAGGIESSVES